MMYIKYVFEFMFLIILLIKSIEDRRDHHKIQGIYKRQLKTFKEKNRIAMARQKIEVSNKKVMYVQESALSKHIYIYIYTH